MLKVSNRDKMQEVNNKMYSTRTLKPEQFLTDAGRKQRHSNMARRAFDAQLKGYLEYVTMPAGTKKPNKKFSNSTAAGRRNRSIERPNHDGNFMGIPVNGLVILDLDTPANAPSFASPEEEQEEQYKLLRNILEIDELTETTVITPSGGFHFYVVWHHDAPLPKTSKGTLSKINPLLKGDVRSSDSNSYAVIPPSFLIDENGHKHYYRTRNWGLLPKLSYDLSVQLTALLDGDSADSAPPKKRQERVYNTNKGRAGYGASLVSRLREGLYGASIKEFHRQRAWVKKSISCHYSDADIADICEELGINQDSKGGNPVEITRQELMIDVTRLSSSITCSAVCRGDFKVSGGKDFLKFKEDLTWEESWKRKLENEKKPQKWRDYRALNLLKVAEAISSNGKRSKPNKAAKLAFRIACNELNRHTSEGRTNILLAYSYLQQRYSVTSSQADKALRVLREAGIITIKRRPLKGSTTVYNVNERFLDNGITKVLRALIAKNSLGKDWDFHRSEIDWDNGVITVINADTGEVVSTDNNKLKKMGNDLRNTFCGILY